ncbi:ATP-binding protein [Streptomyces venezuelae]|uniref:ATP-binding protein n=1 Tax=Streptomyces venezuelae TaxID=54571 RepID=A0A5P2BXI2_STRVZ|nr:ATP-binding protein [Streptomyces venezuelae]QES35166.1 ATP-binding protein [Streptomyces venezuelae]
MPETVTETWAYTLTIPNDPLAVPVSRHTLRLILKAHGLPHFAEAAELVATELIANAVQHTKGPAALRMQWAGAVLRIGVWDTDPTPPSPARGTTGWDETAGRGLGIVRECADGWGWCAREREDENRRGKLVWCELTGAVAAA